MLAQLAFCLRRGEGLRFDRRGCTYLGTAVVAAENDNVVCRHVCCCCDLFLFLFLFLECLGERER